MGRGKSGILTQFNKTRHINFSTAAFFSRTPKVSTTFLAMDWTFAKAVLFFLLSATNRLSQKATSSLLTVENFSNYHIYQTQWMRSGLLWKRWGYEAWKQLPNTSCRRMSMGKQFDPRHRRRRLLRRTPRTHQSSNPWKGFQPSWTTSMSTDRFGQTRLFGSGGRKPACTTGEDGSGRRVVSQISLFVRQVWGCEDGFKNVCNHPNSTRKFPK